MVGGPSYSPVNYDGRYHGNVTLRAALANSYNIPAVKLAQSVGPDNIVALGNKMGLKNWVVDGSYGLSITLGGKEVKLLDHTNAYATFAREGVYKDLTAFTSIKDSKGYEIYEDNRVGGQVVSKEVSYLIWDILSDNNARLPAFGVNNMLAIKDQKIAVKTGTTDSKRDNWTMGYTPSYVVGVWVGNNDNAPMNPYLASGLTGAAPIWNKIMQEVLKNKSSESFAMPDNVFKKYDPDCNRSELFIKGSNIPQTLCPPKEEKKDENKDKKD
jgi:membrane peptidoglycan carboxypeptidase